LIKKSFLHALKASALAVTISVLPFAHANAQSLLRDTEIEETLEDFTVPILRAAGLSPRSRSDYGSRSAYGSMLIAAGLGIAAILAGEGSAGALILGGSVLSQARRYPYFRGHPLSADRIDALRERVDESPYTDIQDSAEDQHAHDMMKAKLRGFLEGPQLVFSRYPLSDQSQYARYARAVAYFKGADLKNALKEIDSLIAEEPENPYFHELKAQILYESGQGTDALPSARRALELSPDAPLLKIALAQSLLETRDMPQVDEAITLIKSALQTEQGNSYAWYLLSTAYGQQSKEALAKYASAERFYAIGDIQRARSFAQRAKEDLPRNEPQWRRASDIIVVADTELAKKKNKRRRPKPFTVSTSQAR